MPNGGLSLHCDAVVVVTLLSGALQSELSLGFGRHVPNGRLSLHSVGCHFTCGLSLHSTLGCRSTCVLSLHSGRHVPNGGLSLHSGAVVVVTLYSGALQSELSLCFGRHVPNGRLSLHSVGCHLTCGLSLHSTLGCRSTCVLSLLSGQHVPNGRLSLH